MEKQLILEDLLIRVEDLVRIIEEREAEGDDLSMMHAVADELRDEIRFSLE